jgi:hypothetical protein
VHEIIKGVQHAARPTGKSSNKSQTAAAAAISTFFFQKKIWLVVLLYILLQFPKLSSIRQGASAIIINNNWANEKLVFRPPGIPSSLPLPKVLLSSFVSFFFFQHFKSR